MAVSRQVIAYPGPRGTPAGNSETSRSILLVDANAVMRAGLAAVLTRADPEWIVHEAASGRQAHTMLRSQVVDLVVLDALIQDCDVMDMIAALRQANPAVRILVIYLSLSRFEVMQLLRSGADGLVPRDCDINELVQAVQTMISGSNCYLPGAMIAQLFRDTVAEGVGANGLTAREHDVLVCVAKGFSNKEIARHLSLSIRTVETHRFNLRKKTGLSRVSDLHKLARRLGLISADPKPGSEPAAE